MPLIDDSSSAGKKIHFSVTKLWMPLASSSSLSKKVKGIPIFLGTYRISEARLEQQLLFCVKAMSFGVQVATQNLSQCTFFVTNKYSELESHRHLNLS